MIKTEKLITTVAFGNQTEASISVSSEGGKLILQMLTNKKQIGDRLEDQDIKDLPKVELNIYNARSIDVLIRHLEAIRKRITPPPTLGSDQLALAC